MQGQMTASGLWAAQGGAGDDLVVLLHGLGATAGVWHGVARTLQARGRRWLAPDLRGHGRSPSAGPFGYGNHAADIAALLAGQDMARVTLLGHSFGGVVGAVLASGLFGPVPARLVALGVKTDWTAAEVAGALSMADRPARLSPTRDEAMARYLKLSGLHGLVPPDAPETAGGIRPQRDGWALAMDPRVFGAVGPAVPDLLAACRAPLRLAAGDCDPMTSPDTLRRLDPGALLLPGLPHNAHVADPATIADLVAPRG
jgi:pimeloyl-ACP methyl ester carboxylesterase